MAGTSLLALIDDIATLLDDVSVMTKVAAKKTAGVLGDDLALNAEKVTGVSADRELPVVWAVFKGSVLNKMILVPFALLISAFMPWAITPMLMLGGAFLCFEGFEKIAHSYLHRHEDKAQNHEAMLNALADPAVDMVAFEKDKIKGAIRTDFILSAEIIVIALGTVQAAPLVTQIAVVAAVAVLMTICVYALVAGIVKLDDAGLYLMQTKSDGTMANAQRSVGRGILWLAPHLMKGLSVIGTAAMFLVGGGILMHGLPQAEPVLHHAAAFVEPTPFVGGILSFFTPVLLNGLFGIIAGAFILLAISGFQKVTGK